MSRCSSSRIFPSDPDPVVFLPFSSFDSSFRCYTVDSSFRCYTFDSSSSSLSRSRVLLGQAFVVVVVIVHGSSGPPRTRRDSSSANTFPLRVLHLLHLHLHLHLLLLLLLFCLLCLLPVSQGVAYHADAGGSGHDRATASSLASVAVTGAEVRRISIGFEPGIGGRPKTP